MADEPRTPAVGEAGATGQPASRSSWPSHLAVAVLYLLSSLWIMAPVLEDPSALLLLPPRDDDVAFRLGRQDQSMVVATVARVARAFTSDPAKLRGPDHCFPMDRSYTLGEHMFGNGLLAAVPLWLGGDPILAYNAVLVQTLWIAAMAMYALMLWFTGSPAASWVAGLLLQFTRTRIADPVHPYVHGDLWTPLALLFLYRVFEMRDLKSVVGLAVFAALLLGESLYPIVSSLVLLAACGLTCCWQYRSVLLGALPRIAAAASLPLATAWWVLGPYIEAGETWGTLSGRGGIFHLAEHYAPGAANFPGWIMLGLAIVGVVVGGSGRRAGRIGDPRVAWVVGALLIFWSSIGTMEVPLLGRVVSPFWLLRDVVPGFSAVRAPGAIKISGYLAMAGLAGLGVAALARRSGPRWALVAAMVVTPLVVAEQYFDPVATKVFGAPLRQEAAAIGPDAAERELLRLVDGRTVLDFPVHANNGTLNAMHLFSSAYHRGSTSACFNSFGSPVQTALESAVMKFPEPAALDAAAGLGFEAILVHWDHMLPRQVEQLRVALGRAVGGGGRIELLGELPHLSVYSLEGLLPTTTDLDSLRALRSRKPAVVSGPPYDIPFFIHNRTLETFVHAPPLLPTDLTARWFRGKVLIRESRVRALLPIGVGAMSSQHWTLRMRDPVPPGDYEVRVRIDGRAGRPIGVRTVTVRSAG